MSPSIGWHKNENAWQKLGRIRAGQQVEYCSDGYSKGGRDA